MSSSINCEVTVSDVVSMIVSTKVTEDDYAFARFARRPSSSLDGANGGLARRAPSGKAAVMPAQAPPPAPIPPGSCPLPVR
jgi:hypothetical protein